MLLSARVLGRTIVDELNQRAAAALLVIGKYRFTRADLTTVGCYNFLAALRLSNVLARDLRVRLTNTRHLFDTVSPDDLLVPQIGAISLAVLGAAFELKGLGGDAPLEAWVRAHRAKDAPDRFVTVATLKHQAAARESGEGHAARRRRDTASSRRASRTAAHARPYARRAGRSA